jgi:hypothetical protein
MLGEVLVTGALCPVILSILLNGSRMGRELVREQCRPVPGRNFPTIFSLAIAYLENTSERIP